MKNRIGVAFYGKVRIPTIGHSVAIDTAKELSSKLGGKLVIGLSGASEPLDISTKRSLAEKIFNHPVMTGDEHTKTLVHFLTYLSTKFDEIHLVAGSDRVGEYRSFIKKYNGKKNKSVGFNFKKWEVHEAGGKRVVSTKDPRKMSRLELTSSVSASKIEALAKEGNWDHFRAYYPGMSDSYVRKIYNMIRRGSNLREDVEIGLTMARKHMPQIDEPVKFIKYLETLGISSKLRNISPDDLKSSQMEFDDDKIQGMRNTQPDKPIIISQDNHVLDGHHRWLADMIEDRKCKVYVVDAPILDLLYHAQHFSNNIQEDIQHKDFGPMLDSFVSFASKKLGIESMPTVRFKKDGDDYNSFAAYNPTKQELSVATKNRHPMDVFRSVAHELVHHKQKEEGRIGHDVEKEGSTGSDVENEANAEAGKIMRWFAKKNPDMFSKTHIVEQTIEEGINDPGKLKAVFLAGGPGSGKDYILNTVLAGQGLREINSDTAFEFLMRKNKLDLEMPESERVERDIVRGRAKMITKEKERLALQGRLGLIINGTADDLDKTRKIKAELESMGYETMMVFVNTSDEVSRQRNIERGKSGQRKVNDGTDKNGNPDGTQDIRGEKWRLAQKNIGELQKIFGNERFSVVDNSIDMRKAPPDVKNKVLDNFNRVRRMTQQFVRSDNKNPDAKKWVESEAQRRGISTYQEPRVAKTLSQIRQDAPKSPKERPANEIMVQARRFGLSYYGFGRFGRKVNGKNTVTFREKNGRLEKVMNEDVNKNFEDIVLEGKDTHKMEWGTDYLRKDYEKNTPGSIKKLKKEDTNKSTSVVVPPGLGPELEPFRTIPTHHFTSGLSESIVRWVNDEKTQRKFVAKYGELAEQKLEEAAKSLHRFGLGSSTGAKAKHIKEFYKGK